MKNETVVIDLDNTICTSEKDYTKCIPKEYAVEALKQIKDNGNYIIIHTERDIDSARITKDWLRIHKIQYDHIQFGKPTARLYIDDRAYRFKKWGKFLKEIYGTKTNEYTEDPLTTYERALCANLTLLVDGDGFSKQRKIKKAIAQARKVADL